MLENINGVNLTGTKDNIYEINIDNFKNIREGRDLFPYECGAEDYEDMQQICFAMYKLKELNLILILFY